MDTLIFDFDGVIANSMKNNFLAWQQALRRHQLPMDETAYYLMEGARPAEVARAFLGGDDLVEETVRSKEELYAAGPSTELYEGIIPLLRWLKDKQVKLGLVTGAARKRSEATLRKFEIFSLFDAVVTADEVQRGKPDPEPYLKGLEYLNSTKENVLVVENAPLGIESAQRAGLTVAAVCTTLPAKRLAAAQHVFKDHPDLIRYIHQVVEQKP